MLAVPILGSPEGSSKSVTVKQGICPPLLANFYTHSEQAKTSLRAKFKQTRRKQQLTSSRFTIQSDPQSTQISRSSPVSLSLPTPAITPLDPVPIPFSFPVSFSIPLPIYEPITTESR